MKLAEDTQSIMTRGQQTYKYALRIPGDAPSPLDPLELEPLGPNWDETRGRFVVNGPQIDSTDDRSTRPS